MKLNKYLDIANELTNMWIMEVSVSPIIVGALETLLKSQWLEVLDISVDD